MRRPRTPEPKSDYLDSRGWDQWDDVDPSEMGGFRRVLTGVTLTVILVAGFALLLWSVLA